MNFKILKTYPDDVILAAWQEFLSDAEYATHYTTPGFFTDPFIRGGERFAVLATDGEKINGVLTAVDAGASIASGFSVRPQTAFRKNIDQAVAAKTLIDGMLEHGGSDARLLNFHCWQPIVGMRGASVTTDDSAVVMLDLSKEPDTIFKDFSEARQREIRKAIKQNVLEIREIENKTELEQLYAIHVEWSRLKNIEPDSREDFAHAINDTEYRKTLVALHNGKVIAGTFFRFCAGGVVEYAGNNSLAENQKFKPNPLIGWRAIEWACANSFTHFSMGASHEFLRRFGGALHPTYRYTIDRTFLRRHENTEKLKNLAVKTYLSLPETTRQRIKQVLGK